MVIIMRERTYVKIDLNALEYNIDSISKKVNKKAKILGVIKADAYGHGAVETAKYIENKCPPMVFRPGKK